MTEITAGREKGSRRPRGYADWRPQEKTRQLLEQVSTVFGQYEDFLPLTVRQVFYRLVGSFGYEKTEQAYARLAEALVRARRARLVPFGHLRDDGVVVAQTRWYQDERDFMESFAEEAKSYQRDLQQGQKYQIELWSESAGMLPQLASVANAFSVPVYSASGFGSLSAVRQIVERAQEWDRLVVLHVGDYDPSGESIFEAMTTDAQAFLEEDRLLASQEIIPVRVALTAEQVARHGLPTAPAKASDSRSRRWDGETCQLEALAPSDLARIVRGAIVAYLDEDVLDHQLHQEQQDRIARQRALPAGTSEDVD